MIASSLILEATAPTFLNVAAATIWVRKKGLQMVLTMLPTARQGRLRKAGEG